MVESVEKTKRKEAYKIMKRTLGDDYVTFSINEGHILEDVANKKTSLCIKFSENGAEQCTIERSGFGVVNVLFDALIDQYEKTYTSLSDITLKKFSVTPDFSKTKGNGSDAKVVVEMMFSNTSNQITTFSEKCDSLFSSMLKTIFKAFEFYINREKSFNRLNFFIEDSKKRNRGDLIQKYTYDLTCVIKHDIIIK